MSAVTHPWFSKDQDGKRWPLFIAHVGVNGTGKSTYIKNNWLKLRKRNLILPSNMLDAAETWGNFPMLVPTFHIESDVYDPKKKRQVRVWDLQYANTFQGTRLVDVRVFQEGEHKREFFTTILNPNRPKSNKYSDGGLVIDDFRNYVITKGTLPNGVVTILTARRHSMLDIFIAGHSFQDFNAEFIQYGMKFVIFKTDLAPNDNVREKILLSQDMEDFRAWVNNHPSKHACLPFDPTNKEVNDWTRQYMMK